MDMTYDDGLQQLRQKIASKPQLEAKLHELNAQRRKFDRDVIALRVAHRQELEDVEKLEGRSLSNYFLQVVGRLDEKLDKERQEAYAAKVKLDAAERELAEIDRDIQLLQSQLYESRVAEAQYQEELEKKKALLRASGTPEGERILEIEQRMGTLAAQKREIAEAISAGRSARSIADQILSEVDSAEGWNTWDILGGSGIITHVAKHSHLDGAQELVGSLQGSLRRFKTELADIQIDAQLQVNVEGFLRFADYFFDGLFADWAVGSRISQARYSVEKTRDQISRMLERLSQMEASADCEIRSLKGQLETLTVHA